MTIIPRLIPPVTIAMQDAMCSLDLSHSLVKNDASGLSGCYVDASANQTLAGFLAPTEKSIMSTLRFWPLFHNPPALIILDVESPIRPQQWGQQNEAYFAALELRVQTVKKTFPNSNVGLYGTPFPAPQANDALYGMNEAKGYRLAVTCGVDFACPVCRSPWMENDPSFETLPAYVQFGLNAAAGYDLPVVPMMAFASTNGAESGKLFSAGLLRWTLANIYAHGGVHSIVIWAGDESQIGPTILSDCGFDVADVGENSIRNLWPLCYPSYLAAIPKGA